MLPAKQQLGQFALLEALLTFVVIVKVDVIKVYFKCNTHLSFNKRHIKMQQQSWKGHVHLSQTNKKMHFKFVQRMRKDSGKHNNARE